MRLNGLRPRPEASEGLKNLNGKWIQICMHGFYSFWDGPGLRAGVGAADFLHVRHPIPQSRSAPAGGWNPRPRSWPWSWRGAGKSGRHGSMFALSGPEGVRPRPGRVVGKQGWPGASRSGATRGACLPDKARVCLSGSRGGQSDADTGVGRPESGGADECRVRLRPDARPAGICVGQSTEPRRRFAGKGCLLRVRALCRACPQK